MFVFEFSKAGQDALFDLFSAGYTAAQQQQKRKRTEASRSYFPGGVMTRLSSPVGV